VDISGVGINHRRPGGLKGGWNKDVKSSLNHWGIKEDVTLHNNNNNKSIITSKFRVKL
jgi:hypothetical protein